MASAFPMKIINFSSPGSNDTVRIRPFMVTLRRINGPYTAVISGAETWPYHNGITARIQPYMVKIRPRKRFHITVPNIAGKYCPFTCFSDRERPY